SPPATAGRACWAATAATPAPSPSRWGCRTPASPRCSPPSTSAPPPACRGPFSAFGTISPARSWRGIGRGAGESRRAIAADDACAYRPYGDIHAGVSGAAGGGCGQNPATGSTVGPKSAASSAIVLIPLQRHHPVEAQERRHHVVRVLGDSRPPPGAGQ